MLSLRDYQLDATNNVTTAISAGEKRILLVSPTGSGKTVIAAELVARWRDSRILIISHRREIIFQTAEKLDLVGVEYGKILSGERPSLIKNIHVASIQTLARRNLPPADIVIIDECHHAVAATYRRIIGHYQESVILGLTATPCRESGGGLGGIFTHLIQVTTVSRLREAGHLVPVDAYAPAKPVLIDVPVRRGDYDQGDLSQKMDQPKLVGDIVDHWFRLAEGKRTLIFATNVPHSRHIIDAFLAAGVAAEHIDGDTPDTTRDEIHQRVLSGQTLVVSNVAVYTEGTDIPSIECVILARPTKSFGLYMQMVGRGLRTCEGKQRLILIDHAGAYHEHGPVDQDIHWQLTEQKPAAVKKLYERTEPLPWHCTQCSHINSPSKNKHCTACGFRPLPEARTPAVGDGMLVAVKKVKVDKLIDKSKYWVECLFKARHRNQKVGAAAHMYKNQFGVWPRNVPMLPSGEEWKLTAKEFLRGRYERKQPQEVAGNSGFCGPTEISGV